MGLKQGEALHSTIFAAEADPLHLVQTLPESSRQWEVEKREQEAAEGGTTMEEDDVFRRGAFPSVSIESNVALRILSLTNLALLS